MRSSDLARRGRDVVALDCDTNANLGISLGIAGCTYHVTHPGGRAFETRPVNAEEAAGRRIARFSLDGHLPGPARTIAYDPAPEYPLTLDLRLVPSQRDGQR